MSQAIEMIGVLKPKPEKLDRVKQIFSDCAEQVIMHEERCLKYTLYTQTKPKGTPTLLLHEKYESQEALDAHLQAPYFQVLAKAMGEEDLLAEPLEFDGVFVEPIAGHK